MNVPDRVGLVGLVLLLGLGLPDDCPRIAKVILAKLKSEA